MVNFNLNRDDSVIDDYFARRTYDESGNYIVKGLTARSRFHLKSGDNQGVFTTGNTDTLSIDISPGKAYVRGFDVYLPGTTVLDVDKPRDTKTVKNASVSYEMGSLLKVNNVNGTPFINIGGAVSYTHLTLPTKRIV